VYLGSYGPEIFIEGTKLNLKTKAKVKHFHKKSRKSLNWNNQTENGRKPIQLTRNTIWPIIRLFE